MLKQLYYGTTETIAKDAPLVGIKPPIHLTTCYGAYQAFMACDPQKRWAIVEIATSQLHSQFLSPFADCRKKDWQKSLDMIGLCVYSGTIPVQAIDKVWIFNPESNWLIARSVLHTSFGVKWHKLQCKRAEVINRWLTGDFVMLDEWLGEQKEAFTKEQKDEMSELWNERSGLDLFYHGLRNEK